MMMKTSKIKEKKNNRLVAWYGNEKRVQNIDEQKKSAIDFHTSISRAAIYPFSRKHYQNNANVEWEWEWKITDDTTKCAWLE